MFHYFLAFVQKSQSRRPGGECFGWVFQYAGQCHQQWGGSTANRRNRQTHKTGQIPSGNFTYILTWPWKWSMAMLNYRHFRIHPASICRWQLTTEVLRLSNAYRPSPQNHPQPSRSFRTLPCRADHVHVDVGGIVGFPRVPENREVLRPKARSWKHKESIQHDMPMILVDMVLIYSDIMWVKQCHKPSHSHHHFNRCYVYHSQSWVVYAYGRKKRARKTYVFANAGSEVMLGWGGVGWAC